MSPAELFRRAAALLVAVGLLAVSVVSVSADDGDGEAAVAAALQPVELTADIPEGYEVLFPLEWGGGSLSHLKGRLAMMGCALDNLWLFDDGRWHPYSQYSVPQDVFFVQDFIQAYAEYVPAGMMYASCAEQPEQELQPTQIIADIPEGYNTPFFLQWGGGSLLHFKGRLATMGCMANNVAVYDPDAGRTHTYNQYNTVSSDSTNQAFLQRYEQFVPAGTAWADCYNICEFGGGQCLTYDELREQEGNFKEYFSRVTSLRLRDFEIDETLPCTQEFHPTIQEHILPLLPIHPDTCIVREIITRSISSGTGGYAVFLNINAPPFVFWRDINSAGYRTTQEYKDLALAGEIHELCHINQDWQQVQGLTTERGFNIDNHIWFKNTIQGKAFIDMTGFIDLDYWQWDLPKDSIYRDVYSHNPIELSAELCSMYLLDKIGATQRYKYKKWISTGWAFNGYFTFGSTPNFDVNTYLTPEIREWLEVYMILPDVSE